MEVKGEKLEIGYDGRIVVREMDITVKKGEITLQYGLRISESGGSVQYQQ